MPIIFQKIEYSGPKCPICNSPMLERSGSFGKFWGCTCYPVCKGIRSNIKCPDCNEVYVFYDKGSKVYFCDNCEEEKQVDYT